MRSINQYTRGEITLEQMVSDITFVEAVNRIKSHTEKWAKRMGYNTKKQLPPEVSDWMDFFATHRFDRNRNDVMALVEKLTGVPLSSYIKSDGDRVLFEVGIMIVPLGNDNGHHYPLGSPCFAIRDSDVFITMDGDIEDRMTRNKELVRPATPEEIDEFIRSLVTHALGTLDTILTSYA